MTELRILTTENTESTENTENTKNSVSADQRSDVFSVVYILLVYLLIGNSVG